MGKVEAASGMSGINTVLHDYAPILRIDTIVMQVGPSQNPMEVLLLCPTHPLRILWLEQFETLVRGWVDGMRNKSTDEINAIIDKDVLDKLTSLNIPSAISFQKGRVFLNTDDYGRFWSIFPAAETPDIRTAVNAALQVLGTGTPEGAISTITPRQVKEKIERYLCHHPYVQTLNINVVNPGDGRHMLEAIKRLLENDLYKNMNFDLKFFSPEGTRHQFVGNAFDDFMTQKSSEDWASGTTLSETEELLLSPNRNPLFPRLIYAKHEIRDLLDDDEGKFDAHLTLVIDFFGTTVSTRRHAGVRGSSSLYNLLAEYVTDYDTGKTTTTWSRMIAPTRNPDLAPDGNTARLYEGHDLLAHLAACAFDWSNHTDRYVTVQLELTDDNGKNHLRMLDRVHQISDWVFTIDRNFGIEFYDDPVKGPGGGNGGYLIDYSPEFLEGVAHRLIISTFHQREIESILRMGFASLLVDHPEDVGEFLDPSKVSRVLQVLKSVSGRLALKLINNPRQAQEVIGLALARLSLERDGRLAGRVLVPVDSHIDLFYQTQKELENSDLTLKRTDLMLVELRGRRLHIDLIEVKNRKASSPAAILELQDEIARKNQSTEEHFRHHFLRHDKARLDSDIKNKELVNILAFYFERACRYGLFDMAETKTPPSGTRDDFIKGLEAVADGSCEVDFGYEGFIFNGTRQGDVEEKVVHGNRITVFGRPAMYSLLDLPLDSDGDGGHAEHEPTEPPLPPTSPVPHSTEAVREVAPVYDSAQEGGRETTGNEEERTKGPPETLALVDTNLVSPRRNALPESRPTEKAAVPQSAEAAAGQESTLPGVSVYLGINTITSQEAFWDPHTTKPKRLLNQHILVVGKSGSGEIRNDKEHTLRTGSSRRSRNSLRLPGGVCDWRFL